MKDNNNDDNSIVIAFHFYSCRIDYHQYHIHNCYHRIKYIYILHIYIWINSTHFLNKKGDFLIFQQTLFDYRRGSHCAKKANVRNTIHKHDKVGDGQIN